MASFFLQLSKQMQEECDIPFVQIYERCLCLLEEQFLEDEYSLFLAVGRNLMSDDLDYHRDREEQFLIEIRERIGKARVKFLQDRKVVYTCCFAGGIMLIIILL